MKRTIHIIFIIVFTIVTLGFTVNKHYSDGELFSLAVFSEPESCCANVCDCCDEESETVQFLADYTFSLDSFEPTSGELEVFAVALPLSIAEPELVLTDTDLVDQDLPPPDNITRLSFHQSFLL